MGAKGKGGGRDTSIRNRAARHGPHILRQLGGGAAAPPGTLAPRPACPPRLRQVVYGAVRGNAEGGRAPTFAAPQPGAIRGDPQCRRLAKALPTAVEKAAAGLRAGRSTAVLRAEIVGFVTDSVVSMMAGRALESARQGLPGDDQHEREMHLGTLTVIVAGHVADVLLEDCAGDAGKSRDPGELVHASLLSAEPALALAVKIAAALAGEVHTYISKLDAAERNDPRIVLIDAVARAVAKTCTRSALRGLESRDDPEHRERLGGLMADAICSEIARSLAGRQTKIGGPGTEE